MCFWKWFKKKETPPVLVLPHPEELEDWTKTIENVSINGMLEQWITDWAVPQENVEHWKTAIGIEVYNEWPSNKLAWGITPTTPAMSWEVGGKRYLACLARWFNTGVIAHEQAHNSYSLLSEEEKKTFQDTYTPLMTSDPLVKLMRKEHAYAGVSYVEAHAEVYRYLGQEMPVSLIPFYPKLLEVVE